MRRVRDAGGFVSFDPSIRTDLWPDALQLHRCLADALALADVVKLSGEELAFISGSAEIENKMPKLAALFGLKLLLVTQGKAGVFACYQDEVTHYPAC